jgi:hypothetical protein
MVQRLGTGTYFVNALQFSLDDLRGQNPEFGELFGTVEQAAEKCQEFFLQGLKPVSSRSFTLGLKPQPPKEKGFFHMMQYAR